MLLLICIFFLHHICFSIASLRIAGFPRVLSPVKPTLNRLWLPCWSTSTPPLPPHLSTVHPTWIDWGRSAPPNWFAELDILMDSGIPPSVKHLMQLRIPWTSAWEQGRFPSHKMATWICTIPWCTVLCHCWEWTRNSTSGRLCYSKWPSSLRKLNSNLST